MAWLPFTLILYHISIYMSRALFYFFRLPLSRALDTHLTTTTLHLILYTFLNCLSRLCFLPFRLPFKVVGGFGLGFTANPISIIYTNIIHLFKLFVKAFNFSFPSAAAFALACLNSFLILILYHNYFYMSSTFSSASVCPWAWLNVMFI